MWLGCCIFDKKETISNWLLSVKETGFVCVLTRAPYCCPTLFSLTEDWNQHVNLQFSKITYIDWRIIYLRVVTKEYGISILNWAYNQVVFMNMWYTFNW